MNKLTFEKQKVRLIEIVAFEWLDKVNGNSYFTYKIYVNKKVLVCDNIMQYGYSDHYIDIAKQYIKDYFQINFNHLSELEKDYNIFVITTKFTNKKKSELINI